MVQTVTKAALMTQVEKLQAELLKAQEAAKAVTASPDILQRVKMTRMTLTEAKRARSQNKRGLVRLRAELEAREKKELDLRSLIGQRAIEVSKVEEEAKKGGVKLPDRVGVSDASEK